jgi:predicted histone-like DNA-binding protein
MALRYRISKRVNSLTKDKEPHYILQAVNTGTVNLDRISYEISQECTLSEVDVQAVLIALGSKLQFHLSEGKIVDLDNLGKFKVGFKGTAQEDATKLTPKGIHKFHINFQPSLKLKRWLKTGVKVYKEEKKSH